MDDDDIQDYVKPWIGLSDKLKVILVKQAPDWTVIQLIEEVEQLLKDLNR